MESRALFAQDDILVVETAVPSSYTLSTYIYNAKGLPATLTYGYGQLNCKIRSAYGGLLIYTNSCFYILKEEKCEDLFYW